MIKQRWKKALCTHQALTRDRRLGKHARHINVPETIIVWLFVMEGGLLKDGERRRMKAEDDGLMGNFLLTTSVGRRIVRQKRANST